MIRRIVTLALALLVVFAAVPAFAAVTRSASPNAPIAPDDGCTDDTNGSGLGGITSTIDYSDLSAGIISDVNIAVQFTQTWRSDIQAALLLGADTVILLNNVDTSGDNLNAQIDDEGVGLCSSATHCGTATNCVTAPGPVCQPNQPLTAFDGDNAGLFTLRVCDRAAQDTGNLVAWSLTVDGTPPLPVELTGFQVQ